MGCRLSIGRLMKRLRVRQRFAQFAERVGAVLLFFAVAAGLVCWQCFAPEQPTHGTMAGGLTRAAFAEELLQYPVAYVDVNAGSYLNVRKTPAGELAHLRLNCREDVVLLEACDGWVLVMRLSDMENGVGMNRQPLGWVSADYLHPYWSVRVAAGSKQTGACGR